MSKLKKDYNPNGELRVYRLDKEGKEWFYYEDQETNLTLRAITMEDKDIEKVQKIATELSKKATGKTLYILDEPTTGLHIADVHRLVDILQRLVDTGNSIIVIEHNLDLIKTCDHIIDLGPEGGDAGGEIVAVGTPEQVCKNEKSYTGLFLKKYFQS